MRLLTFQARRFSWQAFAPTLPDADGLPDAPPDAPLPEDALDDAVVVWLHIEAADVAEEATVFRQTLKHIKWIANKRSMRHVVLHSFTHLGGDTAEPGFARTFIQRLAERLTATDYTVKCTPFGWFCAWNLDVYGDSLAKVYKAI